jgi:hypothetical protein
VNEDLIELVEIFSLRESPPASFTPEALASHFQSSLRQILRRLDETTSKFVDIDTSFKEIDEDQAERFKSGIAKLQNPQLEDDLFELYCELNLYLIIKDRFGEAADWNLKVEFEGRLADTVNRSMHNLSKISLRVF